MQRTTLRTSRHQAQPFAQLIMLCLLPLAVVVTVGLAISATRPRSHPSHPHVAPPPISSPTPQYGTTAGALAVYRCPADGMAVEPDGRHIAIVFSCAASGYHPTVDDGSALLTEPTAQIPTCRAVDFTLAPQGITMFYLCPLANPTPMP